MLDTSTRTTLLTLARRILAAPCCDDGTALARAVVAALDTPASAHPGRVWRKGEACPIVAEGQRRVMKSTDGDHHYKVGAAVPAAGAIELHYIMPRDNTDTAEWLDSFIQSDPLTEDWHEPVPLASTLPRVEVKP